MKKNQRNVIEKISDKSLALQAGLFASLATLSAPSFAAGELVSDTGKSRYSGETLGGNNVKGSFLDGEGGGIEGVEQSMTNLTKVVVAVSAFLGFCLAAFGVYTLYKASKPNSQSNAMNGFIALIAGCALAILPWIVFSGSNTITNFSNGKD